MRMAVSYLYNPDGVDGWEEGGGRKEERGRKGDATPFELFELFE